LALPIINPKHELKREITKYKPQITNKSQIAKRKGSKFKTKTAAAGKKRKRGRVEKNGREEARELIKSKEEWNWSPDPGFRRGKPACLPF